MLSTIEKPHRLATGDQPLLRLPADDQLDALADRFANAQPFPSIVLDHMLAAAPAEIAASFPDADWPHWHIFRDTYQKNKRQGTSVETFPPLIKQIIHEFWEPKFLRFLEKVTGIDALIVDPHLFGGGMHLTGPGGVLKPHIDFHHLKEMRLFRRINVLLYLNSEWEAEWGGCLKLFEKGSKTPAQTIVPEFGRMVIFRTDYNSVHGFPDPVVDGKWRKSLALYYYTSQEATSFSGDATTYWQDHDEVDTGGKLAMFAYRWLLRGSTVFARAAHAFNPHLRANRKPPADGAGG